MLSIWFWNVLYLVLRLSLNVVSAMYGYVAKRLYIGKQRARNSTRTAKLQRYYDTFVKGSEPDTEVEITLPSAKCWRTSVLGGYGGDDLL